MPTQTTPSSRQPTSEIHRDTSCNGLSQCCLHVHQPVSQVCKPGELLALRKVKTPHNGKTSVSRFPLTKQEISSQYSGCFERIGCFPGDPYKIHLKPDHKPARHVPLKEEIKSLVKQGILEEVKEHTDWVNSYVIVEKDNRNQHAPNHTIMEKTRICLDPRDLTEALGREPYHTHSTGEITTKFPTETEWNMPDISQHPWKCAWMTTSLLLQRKPNNSIFKTKPLSKAVQHTAHRRGKLFLAMQNSHQTWKTHQIS